MKNALIFSLDFIGHRQIYVFVLSHILHELGYKLHIAGNFSEILNNSFYLDMLKHDEKILKINTTEIDDYGLGISNDAFVNLQNRYNIDLTIFAEADDHIPLFNSQIFFGKKRFRGRIIGIFLRPNYYNFNFNLISKIKYIKRLKRIWKSDMRLFYEVLNPHFKLLDVSLFIDDYFVTKNKMAKWLPDVFQQYADKLVLEEKAEQRTWIKKLEAFKNENKGSTLILYFGTAQKRRGYEELLKLSVENKACFIHCGVRNEKETYNTDTDELRKILEVDNRLFETNEYIADPVCIEYFFCSVSHLILPYKNFYGSSGVMLQALSYNIPVLVPNIGVMGYRTTKYNLGMTFSEKSSSLTEQFNRFKETPKEIYRDSIEYYMNFQSSDQLKRVLVDAIIGGESKTVIPL